MMKQLSAAMLVGAIVMPSVSVADELTDARIKELVYEAILENPAIIMEAVQLLEQRQQQDQQAAANSVLQNERDRLERDPNAIELGNPDGDVTVVEFFDYNCPYCRREMPHMEALIMADPNVRVIYREWPILGDGSVFAARAALAARNQGKYEEFHIAMMGMQGRAEEASVLRIAREVGLDINQLEQDMQSPEVDEHIQTSVELTGALGFNGTPSFVIGDALVPGFVESDVLADYVDAARAAQK